jgi:hypothetical protein
MSHHELLTPDSTDDITENTFQKVVDPVEDNAKTPDDDGFMKQNPLYYSVEA